MIQTDTNPPTNPPANGLQTPPRTPLQTATTPPTHTHPHTPKGLSPSLSGAQPSQKSRPLQGVKITADLLNIQRRHPGAPQALAQAAWIMPGDDERRQAWRWVGRGVQRSIRFTDEQVQRIEREAVNSGVSFPEMVRLCCDFALGYVQGLRGEPIPEGELKNGK